LSVHDKTGLDKLVQGFLNRNISLVASGGTADTIRKLGQRVTEVSDYTGTPEMPGGLVKTLHPKIHAGILGDWNDPAQKQYLEQNRVNPFDFVVVNLYPFGEVVKSDSKNLKKAVDNIDIGGPALIRAAGKGALLNHRVVPLTNPRQYQQIIDELDAKREISDPIRYKMVFEAFSLTTEYDALIRDYFQRLSS
jgi:phosphoribosylaminoimidazolecarboxamide formyltransferase/IMP cyclohydrolase